MFSVVGVLSLLLRLNLFSKIESEFYYQQHGMAAFLKSNVSENEFLGNGLFVCRGFLALNEVVDTFGKNFGILTYCRHRAVVQPVVVVECDKFCFEIVCFEIFQHAQSCHVGSRNYSVGI